MSSSEWPHYGKNISFVCQCYFLFLSCLICSHFCNTAHRENNSWCSASPLSLHQKSALLRKLKPQQTCRGWKCLAKHFSRVFVCKEGLHVSCLKPAEHTAVQNGFLLKLLPFLLWKPFFQPFQHILGVESFFFSLNRLGNFCWPHFFLK